VLAKTRKVSLRQVSARKVKRASFTATRTAPSIGCSHFTAVCNCTGYTSAVVTATSSRSRL